MKTGFLYINDIIFETLIAVSEDEQQRGLMYVEWLPPNMAFPYKYASVNKFWMRDTLSPLDIIFCHAGKITQIHAGTPYSTELIGNNSLSDLVIELPYGTVESSNIKIGDSVGFVKR